MNRDKKRMVGKERGISFHTGADTYAIVSVGFLPRFFCDLHMAWLIGSLTPGYRTQMLGALPAAGLSTMPASYVGNKRSVYSFGSWLSNFSILDSSPP